ncbi:MAG: hypothetical protein M1829_000547 [Trizodia sp. TS-e1964]|nr:MAG: hypothetical protein M1829_000547 [Trizodia sp. TS-e1964]
MGNDGGSIPTRRELVKEAARNPTTTELKSSQQEAQSYHWSTCPLSHQPLHQPVVSDSSGKLYNKDAVLEFLLPASSSTPGRSKSDNEEVLEGRVRSLRDVVELRFEVEKAEAVGKREARDGALTRQRGLEKWVCPITRKELGPGVKALYLVPCGHVFSESAIKEVSGDVCLQCNAPFTSQNIIPILPIGQTEIDRLSARIAELKSQGLTHSLKKAAGSSKKRKKNGQGADVPVEMALPITEEPPTLVSLEAVKSTATSTLNRSGTSTPKPLAASAGIKNAATASLTAKVLEEEKERRKRQKLGMNDSLKSLFSSSVDGGGPKKRDGDFMTRGFSIPAKR